MFELSKRSLSKLEGVHPKLQDIVEKAIQLTEVDFGISEGVRTIKRQKSLVKKGASKTMNSRHLTGHAVDVFAYVNGDVSWEWKYYDKIAAAMEQAAINADVNLVWGGEWISFKDGPHFELPRQEYP